MANKVRKTVPTLRAWGKRGYGPKRFKMGKTVIYREDGDIRWLNGVEMEQPRDRAEPRGRGRPRKAEAGVGVSA
jgi:hypothetical protein